MYGDKAESERLKHLWHSASDIANLRNKETAQASTDISKEKTQYFEKIALGSGATIGALVSFLGAHSSRLQPRWLLRTVLVTLVVTMTASLFRNWLYPFYIFSAKLLIEFEAKQEENRRKRDFLEVTPALAVEDGQRIDFPQWLEQHIKDDKLYEKLINEHSSKEEKAWLWTVRMENTSLVAAGLSMVLMILLAWRNF